VVRPQNTTVNPFSLFVREETLHCVASSDPSTPPLISWYRLVPGGGMTQVNSSDRLAIDRAGSLRFHGVADAEWILLKGWYRCQADNGYTSDSADVFLHVLTSPPAPTQCEFTARTLQRV